MATNDDPAAPDTDPVAVPTGAAILLTILAAAKQATIQKGSRR